MFAGTRPIPGTIVIVLGSPAPFVVQRSVEVWPTAMLDGVAVAFTTVTVFAGTGGGGTGGGGDGGSGSGEPPTLSTTSVDGALEPHAFTARTRTK